MHDNYVIIRMWVIMQLYMLVFLNPNLVRKLELRRMFYSME